MVQFFVLFFVFGFEMGGGLLSFALLALTFQDMYLGIKETLVGTKKG